MTDELKEPASKPKAKIPPIQPENGNPTPKKSNKLPWVIAGVVIVGICLCLILCIAFVASDAVNEAKERKPIETVLDTFMRKMEANNAESAYLLFSPRAQRQTRIEDLKEMYKGNNRFLFEGYESLSVKSLNLSTNENADSKSPQGIIATVGGVINYPDGFTGEITATLEKVDGTWRINYVHITIPPNKFSP